MAVRHDSALGALSASQSLVDEDESDYDVGDCDDVGSVNGDMGVPILDDIGGLHDLFISKLSQDMYTSLVKCHF